jgi:hypothetical protein
MCRSDILWRTAGIGLGGGADTRYALSEHGEVPADGTMALPSTPANEFRTFNIELDQQSARQLTIQGVAST